MPGVLDTRTVSICCHCATCSPDGLVWEPSVWERHCGAGHMRWLISIKVLTKSSAPVALNVWLQSQGYALRVNKTIVPGGAPPRQFVPLSEVNQEAALRAGDGNQEVDPLDVFPEELRVMCNGMAGWLYPGSWTIECLCSACQANANAAIMSPNEWEKHSGSKAKKSSASITIVPGQVPEIPAGAKPQSIKTFLERKGLKVKPTAQKGGGRMLVPLQWNSGQ